MKRACVIVMCGVLASPAMAGTGKPKISAALKKALDAGKWTDAKIVLDSGDVVVLEAKTGKSRHALIAGPAAAPAILDYGEISPAGAKLSAKTAAFLGSKSLTDVTLVMEGMSDKITLTHDEVHQIVRSRGADKAIELACTLPGDDWYKQGGRCPVEGGARAIITRVPDDITNGSVVFTVETSQEARSSTLVNGKCETQDASGGQKRQYSIGLSGMCGSADASKDPE
jgi:hypothetical protein